MQDSLGFWIPRLEFRIPGTRFQSLVGLRIDWQVFPIPKPTIPDSTSKIVLDAGTNQKFPGVWIWISLHGAKMEVSVERPGNSSSRA